MLHSNHFHVYDLRVEALLNSPARIANPTPELSWKIASTKPGTRQTAYRIRAAETEESLVNGNALLWDSGWVESRQSQFIRWNGNPLKTGQQVFWTVSVRDENGTLTESSALGCFELTLMENRQWNSRWIHFDGNNYSLSAPCPYLRRDFRLEKEVKRARLFITARGLFDARINSKRVGNDHFVPGWTDFHKQIQFMTYDVTELLRKGSNAIGVILGDGWCCGNLTCFRKNHVYAPFPELLARLEIIHTDDTETVVCTDASWKAATGPILSSDIYDGETYDARLELPGWDAPDFNDHAWRNAVEGNSAEESPRLVAKVSPPVRKLMEVKPVRILNPMKDVFIWDFGQNLTGRFRVRLKGPSGRIYTFRVAEMLQVDGTLYTLNYRNARSTDYYICDGRENVEWEPLFTFHGFRYLQIDGFQLADTRIEDIQAVAVVLGTDLEKSGTFECGNEKVNRLYSNIVWSQRGNFLEIPTDCPQRDERLGWTGDAQLFIGTSAYNMNVLAFFRKWLSDLRDAQLENGSIPAVVPDVLGFLNGEAGWADAVVICPWVLWLRYGCKSILEENYTAMKRWIDYQKDTSSGFLRNESSLGDWLSPDPMPTPVPLVATAYFALTCRLFGNIAELLGKKDDAEFYTALSEKIGEAFRSAYVGADGLLKTRNQTSCVMALQFGLLTKEQQTKNATLLESLIRENGTRLNTGFIGTALLSRALSAHGLDKTAYDLLLQEEFPSWLYSVNQGATTLWERWNSYSHKDGFGDVGMNSFNHYAYGAVGEWMFARVGGLEFRAPDTLLFAACPDRRLGYAETSLETPFGKAFSFWRYEGENIRWRVSAPPNTVMRIELPLPSAKDVFCNGRELTDTKLEFPCGEYEFVWTCAKDRNHADKMKKEAVPC